MKYAEDTGLLRLSLKGTGKKVASQVDNVLKSGTDFYIGPNEKILPCQFKSWIGKNMQNTLNGKVEKRLGSKEKNLEKTYHLAVQIDAYLSVIHLLESIENSVLNRLPVRFMV